LLLENIFSSFSQNVLKTDKFVKIIYPCDRYFSSNITASQNLVNASK
jgi:hypothetical protein